GGHRARRFWRDGRAMSLRKFGWNRRAIILATGAVSIIPINASRAADVTSSWTAGVSGNWSNAANWTNTPAVVQYPNNGNGGFPYNAAANFVGTITFSENITVQQLALTSATLDGNFNLQVNQSMTWNGGGMRGTGTTTIPVGATLDLTGPLRRTLTRTLDNFGTTNWLDGGLTGDTFSALGTFNNKPGATTFLNSTF